MKRRDKEGVRFEIEPMSDADIIYVGTRFFVESRVASQLGSVREFGRDKRTERDECLVYVVSAHNLLGVQHRRIDEEWTYK